MNAKLTKYKQRWIAKWISVNICSYCMKKKEKKQSKQRQILGSKQEVLINRSYLTGTFIEQSTKVISGTYLFIFF